MAWPNLYVVGAGKAGTTSIHRYLDEHPDIYMSPEKEPHFFNLDWDTAEEGDQDLEEAEEDYLALFADADEASIVGETSPGYLRHPEVPDRIHSKAPEARILVSVRDPVKRAHSDYLMAIRAGTLERDLVDILEKELDGHAPDEVPPLIDRGRYATHVERYMDTFGRDDVHVLVLDDLKANPLAALKDIARFLDVDPEAMEQVDYETVHNPFGVPRNPVAAWLLQDERVHALAQRLVPEPVRIFLGEHLLLKKPEKPPIDPQAKDLLVRELSPEIDRLEELIDRELPELRASWDTG